MTDPDQGRVTVGVPRESLPGEGRVALTPQAAGTLVADGARVLVELGAGESAFHPDAEYADAGAEPVEAGALYAAADVIVRVSPPSNDEADRLPRGCLLVGQLAPLSRPELVSRLAARRRDELAMELIPRISRAQKMDALSSQANIAGYKAVLIAAESLPKFFPMHDDRGRHGLRRQGAGDRRRRRRAAGHRDRAPARAQVWGYDVRPGGEGAGREPGRQVPRVRPRLADAEDKGGYAKALSAEAQPPQQEMLAEKTKDFDVVITTALVPGRPAPRLVTKETVAGMRPGSVIVDLAAEAGGNCELTEPDETVVRHGVTIHGPTNLPATMPVHASQLYARNVTELLAELLRDGARRARLHDEIVTGACVTHAGEVVNEAVKAALAERTA